RAGHDVRDLAAVYSPREALVEVRVAREDGVGPETGRPRRRVDVVGEAAAATVSGVDGGWRMMAGDDHRPFPCLAGGSEPGELVLEEVKLLVAGEHGIATSLARDDARALEDVRVEADDRHERSVESEVDARLVHGRADDARRVGGRRRMFGAEVALEGGQRLDLRQVGLVTEDHPVVVAGDREDRAVVGTKRLVELVVVVLTLAEVVND